MKCILKKEEIIQKEKRTEPVSKWLCLGINDNVNDFDVGLEIDKLILLNCGKRKENLWWAARTEIVVNTSANELNDHLARINTQSKMHSLESVQIRSFSCPYLDTCHAMMNIYTVPFKYAQEVIFGQEMKEATHPALFFNNYQVSQRECQKQFIAILPEQWTFGEYWKNFSFKIFLTID